MLYSCKHDFWATAHMYICIFFSFSCFKLYLIPVIFYSFTYVCFVLTVSSGYINGILSGINSVIIN